MSIGTGHVAVKADREPEGPQRPGTKWKLALAGAAGVFVVLACYDLASISGQDGSNGTAPASATATPAAGQAKSPSRSPAMATPAISSPEPGTPAGPASHALAVISITAFGPEGTSDGDNPATAYRVLDVSTNQPWYSQWYATPDFGGLQPGTGLLLDMGRTVTVTDVRLVLGSTPGADVQIRMGNAPFLDQPIVASTQGASGDVLLTATAPARGRYVLIWFTRLPPDGHGHYQVSVYNVSVDG